MVTFFLNSFRGIYDISISSINIYPSNTSTILAKDSPIVLLPAPVLPTIPIFSYEFILKLI
jgi:hypothetical protein